MKDDNKKCKKKRRDLDQIDGEISQTSKEINIPIGEKTKERKNSI